MKNIKETLQLRKDLSDWLTQYKPAHLLTVQLPLYLRTSDYEKSKETLKRIMTTFEQQILKRHWNRNHLKFIVFSEQNRDLCWHYHILLCDNDFTDERLTKVVQKVIRKEKLESSTLDLKRITETPENVYSYCAKNFNVDNSGRMDVNRLIISSELFGLDFDMRKTDINTPKSD